MNAMWTGFAAAIVIAITANFALLEMGFSSEERYSGQNVRLK